MPDQYVPGAELHLLDSAPMSGDGGARVIWHITWDRNATAAAPADLLPFDSLVQYFTSGGAGAAPHLIWDPFTGRIAQMFPATSRSKSVINAPGGVETNRKGNVCIQIETLFFPYCRVGGKTYATVADTPCVGLDRIMAWLRSWGVPDVWPMGAPDWNSHRNAAVWDSQSGHYGHSQVPENDHNDPGPMPGLFSSAHVSEEDDDMTPDQIAKAPIQYRGVDGRQAPVESNVEDFLNLFVQNNAQIKASLATQAEVIKALVSQLGQAHGVDTDTVIAAIEDATGKAVDRYLANAEITFRSTTSTTN